MPLAQFIALIKVRPLVAVDAVHLDVYIPAQGSSRLTGWS